MREGLEPMTALTDAILAAWTAFLCALLFVRAAGRRPVMLWACGFAAAAASSLAGAAYHGCRLFFAPGTAVLLWKLVPLTTGIAALCLGMAASVAWLAPAVRRVAAAILIAEFVACVIAAALSNSFLVAAIDYLPVLIAILIGAVARLRMLAARFIALGVIVSFIAIGVQVSSLHIGGLDHNDVFHLIQVAAMFLLYRGGVLLRDLSANEQVRRRVQRDGDQRQRAQAGDHR